MPETGCTPEILHIPLAIESTNSLRFLWIVLSIEGAALSIETTPFYRMAGFLGIPRKRSAFYRKHKFLESAEHIHDYSYSHACKHTRQGNSNTAKLRMYAQEEQ